LAQVESDRSMQKADASRELLRACENFTFTDTNMDDVADLIEKKADVNYQDEVTQLGALHYAAYHGSLPLLKLLFQANANVAIVDRGFLTPLHLACHEAKSVDVVGFLCDVCADACALDSIRGTPLHWAVYKGNHAMTKCLLSYESGHAALRLFDANDHSAMDLARSIGRVDLQQLLLDPLDAGLRPKGEDIMLLSQGCTL